MRSFAGLGCAAGSRARAAGQRAAVDYTASARVLGELFGRYLKKRRSLCSAQREPETTGPRYCACLGFEASLNGQTGGNSSKGREGHALLSARIFNGSARLTCPYLAVLTKHLPTLLSGSRLPADEANAASRNLQYELFVAAMFARSGFHRFGEPDALFEHQGCWYGLAAKRLLFLLSKAIAERIQGPGASIGDSPFLRKR